MLKHCVFRCVSSCSSVAFISVMMISCGGSGSDNSGLGLPADTQMQFLSNETYETVQVPEDQRHSLLFSALGTGTNQSYIAVNSWTSSPDPTTENGNLMTFYYVRKGSTAEFKFSGRVISNQEIIPGPVLQQQGIGIELSGTVTGLKDTPITGTTEVEIGDCTYSVVLNGMAESSVPVHRQADNVTGGKVYLRVSDTAGN